MGWQGHGAHFQIPSSTYLISDVQPSVPFISVVMPNFNKAPYIEAAVRSILAQTYDRWELLIVDDASTDESQNIMARFDDPRIRTFYNTRQQGGNVCRNHGLNQASGDYVLFFDSDDLLAATCLEKRVEQAMQHPQTNLLIFGSGVFYTTPGDDARQWLPRKQDALARFLMHDLPWHIMQPLWKRTLLLDAGGFDETFERLQDVELHTRMLFNTQIAFEVFPNSIDCYYRIHQDKNVFSTYQLYQKRVASSVQYIRKFMPAADQRHLGRCLLGTYLKLLNEIAYSKRQGRLSHTEYKSLVEELQAVLPLFRLTGLAPAMIRLHRFLNELPVKIKGSNFILEKYLVKTPS